MARVLEEDYFLEVDVRFGSISGGLPVLVTDTSLPVVIYLDPVSTTVAPLLALYRDDFDAFGPFVKDFVRSTVFSRIANLVPSSTREGSEAFLRHLRSKREWFEYELDDKANLEDIFEELHAGRMTVADAKKRLANTDRSFVEVSRDGTAPLSSVIREPESEVSQDDLSDPLGAIPGIDRREEETRALLITYRVPWKGTVPQRVRIPPGKLSLQPVAIGADDGGNDIVRSTSV